MITVVGVTVDAASDGSHAIELSDGTVAIIPREQVPTIATTLQTALARRVFAQSQRLDIPTESTLALPEFHLEASTVAMLGAATNLACNLHECGWVAFLCEEDVLRSLKESIDRVLLARASSLRTN